MSTWIDFFVYAALTMVFWGCIPAWSRFTIPVVADRNPDWLLSHPEVERRFAANRWFRNSCRVWTALSLVALLAVQAGAWSPALFAGEPTWEALKDLNSALFITGVLAVAGCFLWFERWLRATVPLATRRQATLARRSVDDYVPRHGTTRCLRHRDPSPCGVADCRSDGPLQHGRVLGNAGLPIRGIRIPPADGGHGRSAKAERDRRCLRVRLSTHRSPPGRGVSARAAPERRCATLRADGRRDAGESRSSVAPRTRSVVTVLAAARRDVAAPARGPRTIGAFVQQSQVAAAVFVIGNDSNKKVPALGRCIPRRAGCDRGLRRPVVDRLVVLRANGATRRMPSPP